jgi:hypothetical protein
VKDYARVLLVGLLATIAAATVAAAQEQVSIPESDEIAISEAYHLWRTLGERVWPGWTESPMPMVFVAGNHDFAIGFDDLPTGFAPFLNASRIAPWAYARGSSIRRPPRPIPFRGSRPL